MRFKYYLIILTFLLSACGKGKGKYFHEEFIKKANPQNNRNDEEIINCLYKKSGYSETTPTDLGDFADIIGISSRACYAKRDHVKKFAMEIFRRKS